MKVYFIIYTLKKTRRSKSFEFDGDIETLKKHEADLKKRYPKSVLCIHLGE